MVVGLTHTLFVVEGVYKTSIVDHVQPCGEAVSTLSKLQRWLTDS